MNRKDIEQSINNRTKGKFLDFKNVEIDKNEDLSGLDLHDVDFTDAQGENINFTNCNLENTIFTGCRFEHANFEESNLKKTLLKDCDLRFANFHKADCRGAIFECTIMECSKHDGIIVDDTTVGYKMHIPETGPLIGYKKCYNNLIVTLLIPADARRVCSTTRPCRCDKAKVINITDFEGDEHYTEAYSLCSNTGFKYELGKMVYPDSFNPDRWMESTHGIHFWVTREEAVKY